MNYRMRKIYYQATQRIIFTQRALLETKNMPSPYKSSFILTKSEDLAKEHD